MRRLILATALFIAACSGGDVLGDGTEATTSSTTSPTTTSTTTTTSITTTTTVPAPIPIFPTTKFSARDRYRGSLSTLDLEFELQFELEGWRTVIAEPSRADFFHFANDDRNFEPGAEVGVVAWMADLQAAEVVSEFRTHPNVAESSEPAEATVNGIPALEFDLLLITGDVEGQEACMRRFPLLDGPNGWVEEVLACTWNRIWVVSVDGWSVSIIGSAGFDDLDPARTSDITEFEPLLDDFINGITFCTEATPCDD